MPIAASRLMAPVGMHSTRTRGVSEPMRMMEPLPQLFSICEIARPRAFFLSSCTVETAMARLPPFARESAQRDHPEPDPNKVRSNPVPVNGQF